MQKKERGKKPKYDEGYKDVYFEKTETLHLLKKYADAEWAEKLIPENLCLRETEIILPDYERRLPDLVYEIYSESEEILAYLILQFQSTMDFTMAFRFATEMQGILLKNFIGHEKKERKRKEFRLPAVIPVLFYNGKRRWTAVRAFHEYQKQSEMFKGHVLDFEYYLIDISSIDDAEILDSNYLVDNIIYLDKHRDEWEEVAGKIALILERVKELPVEKQAVFERWMKHVFLAEMDEKEKEQFHKLWEENERSEGMFTTHAISEMIREMKVKEKTEGRKEGKAEGKVENTIELIMRKLDQGLSAEAIACWMELDESYVKEIGEFHRMYPEETGEKIAERSLKAKENDKNE